MVPSYLLKFVKWNSLMPWDGLKQYTFVTSIKAQAGRHAISVPSYCPLRLPLVWQCPPHSRWGSAGAMVPGLEDWEWTSGRRVTDTKDPCRWKERVVGCQWQWSLRDEKKREILLQQQAIKQITNNNINNINNTIKSKLT